MIEGSRLVKQVELHSTCTQMCSLPGWRIVSYLYTVNTQCGQLWTCPQLYSLSVCKAIRVTTPLCTLPSPARSKNERASAHIPSLSALCISSLQCHIRSRGEQWFCMFPRVTQRLFHCRVLEQLRGTQDSDLVVTTGKQGSQFHMSHIIQAIEWRPTKHNKRTASQSPGKQQSLDRWFLQMCFHEGCKHDVKQPKTSNSRG